MAIAYQFGSFELDVQVGELRKSGRKIHLPEKPLLALAFLLEHAGEVVSREQLRDRLWRRRAPSSSSTTT